MRLLPGCGDAGDRIDRRSPANPTHQATDKRSAPHEGASKLARRMVTWPTASAPRIATQGRRFRFTCVLPRTASERNPLADPGFARPVDPGGRRVRSVHCPPGTAYSFRKPHRSRHRRRCIAAPPVPASCRAPRSLDPAVAPVQGAGPATGAARQPAGTGFPEPAAPACARADVAGLKAPPASWPAGYLRRQERGRDAPATCVRNARLC